MSRLARLVTKNPHVSRLRTQPVLVFSVCSWCHGSFFFIFFARCAVGNRFLSHPGCIMVGIAKHQSVRS